MRKLHDDDVKGNADGLSECVATTTHITVRDAGLRSYVADDEAVDHDDHKFWEKRESSILTVILRSNPREAPKLSLERENESNMHAEQAQVSCECFWNTLAACRFDVLRSM